MPIWHIPKIYCLSYRTYEKISVIKDRRLYVKGPISACLDRVDGLGSFLELEIMAEEGLREDALAQLWEVLELLGYNRSDTTTMLYLTMLQRSNADSRGCPASGTSLIDSLKPVC